MWGNQYVRLLRASSKTKKNATKIKRQPNQKNNAKRTREQHTKTSRITSKNHQQIVQNGSPEGVLGGPGASWPQGRRQEPPKIDFGGLRGGKKNFGRARGRPKKISGSWCWSLEKQMTLFREDQKIQKFKLF